MFLRILFFFSRVYGSRPHRFCPFLPILYQFCPFPPGFWRAHSICATTIRQILEYGQRGILREARASDRLGLHQVWRCDGFGHPAGGQRDRGHPRAVPGDTGRLLSDPLGWEGLCGADGRYALCRQSWQGYMSGQVLIF